MKKAGWKTTEFWVTVVINLISVVGVLKGILPAQTAAIILAVLDGLYGVLRTLIKEPDITTLVIK
jgi:hypothetical protein